jgi:dienelactone hydrolase
MPSETVSYEADGLSMKGQLFRPAGASGARPGVLVFPEAFGLGEHALSKAERIAGLGYVALACDLHGEALHVAEFEKMMPLLGPVASSSVKTRARAKGALAALITQPGVDASKIAAIGYCFGGTGVLELARSGADVKGVVTFHGGLATPTPEDAKNIKCPVLVLHGADDPFVKPAEVTAFKEEMEKAHVKYEFVAYPGAVHSFTRPDAGNDNSKGAAYNEAADKQSWAAMQKFFNEIFKG